MIKAQTVGETKKDYISGPAYFPIGLIQDALGCYVEQLDKNEYANIHAKYSDSCVADYFSAFEAKDGVNLINELNQKYKKPRIYSIFHFRMDIIC